MGRHSKDEVKQIFVYTMDSLSILLGTKPYFMTDKPSFLDACVFAFLAEFVLVTIDNEFNIIARRYENLTSYCQQIHARYYV